MQKTKKGFTLIELLVVIGIIGLLASLAIVSLNSARAKSRDAVRLSNMQRVYTSLEQFFDSRGRYPSTQAGNVGGVNADTPVGLGYSQNQAPVGFYTALYSGGFKVATGTGLTESALCIDNGVTTVPCDLELTSPMPKEPLITGTTAGTLCGILGTTTITTPCEYAYNATEDTVGGRGWQNFNMFYNLESSAPKQFGDGLLCVANRKGTKCSKGGAGNPGYTQL